MGWYCAMKSPDGSSPLARRTLETGKLTIDDGRFIPACAGNSKLRDPRPALKTVHPRLRGELEQRGNEYLNEGGSSPLARGTLWLCLQKLAANRFIPACAGNSIMEPIQTLPSLVHPRLRGELNDGRDDEGSSCGSSPLARGTRTASVCVCFPKTVHPRLRGELLCLVFAKLVVGGSSPLARGTRLKE